DPRRGPRGRPPDGRAPRLQPGRTRPARGHAGDRIVTPQITAARIVVPEDAPRTVWMLERGEGVTASRVWSIAKGGIRTWRRELEQMMNGSTFRGTAATRAGSAREAALLDEA